MIELQNVTKLYGKVIGVNDITLSLPAGAYGLLGPNGSGKSTLLNLIMGQLKPTIGTVRVLGRSPRNNKLLYHQLGYCPSSEGLYASISAFEWVRYLQQLQGMSRSAASAAAAHALRLVGMEDAMHRDISGYSRGMRQRTKLAQAIAHDPAFLILDEPFNGLDPIGRHDMSVALRNWIKQGKNLLLASHILHEIESITQSFLLICGGRLLASGTAQEVSELLVDLPNEITVRCRQPQLLARLLIDGQCADALTIDSTNVVFSTPHPAQVLSQFPAWMAAHEGLGVSEIHAADESLQALFNSLLKIHRGEI